MKNFKKYILGFAALTAVAGFTACQDDFDDNIPGFEVPKATIEPNTTILELKQTFWQNTVNYIDTIRTREDGSHYIIAGRVITSDRAGNVYKKIVIQDETAALALSINANSLYNDYRIGQEIVMDVTGMYIGKYNGMEQLGFPDYYEKTGVWEATFMPLEFFKEHAQLNGMPEPEKIDTLTINTFSELPSNPTELPYYQSRIVRFNNVYFQDGGEKAFTDGYKVNTNRLLVDSNGQTITVRTSGYALFRDEILPAGNGDVVAILDYYATSEDADSPWQLTLNAANGCMNFGNPTIGPGAENNPYTVEEVVALEAADNSANGWVTGYIVGAVAPAVTSVGSNNDIQWGDSEVDLANTLVIGPTADCKDYNKCLVIELPQNSPLRQYGNLVDNPGNYGKQIWVNGRFAKVMDTWGITGNSGATSQWKIEGVDAGGEAGGSGTGTETDPYTVADVQGGATGTGVWVVGYIVGSIPDKYFSEGVIGVGDNPSLTNMLISDTPNPADVNSCIPVALPAGDIRNALNLQANPGNLGKKVLIQGNLEKYFGVAGVKNVTKYTLDGASTPDTPDTPTTGGSGNGTADSPYDALGAIAAANSGVTGEVYVQGIISTIKEISTSFGNATYYISNDGTTTNEFCIYRGYYLDGAKFTSESQIKVGDKVVVKGELIVYGSTPELQAGNSIVSINGAGGSTTPDEPVTPPSTGDNSESNPLTCEEVLASGASSTKDATMTGVWVGGYIVGFINGATNNETTATFSATDALATNILIASTPDCKDYTKCVAVQLPSGSVRSALNLKDHPEYLGKQVVLFGDIYKYMGFPGLKNTSAYTLK